MCAAARAHRLLGLARGCARSRRAARLGAAGRPRRCSRSRPTLAPKCAFSMRPVRPSVSTGLSSTSTSYWLLVLRRGCWRDCRSRVLSDITRRLAQAVDRRVGDLAEILAEEVADQPRYLSDSTASGVSSPIEPIASLALLDHRAQDQLHVLERLAGGDLAAAQLVAVEARHGSARRARSGRRCRRCTCRSIAA